jgi:predicted lipoprotein with Yx(FWY)xxD motif
MTKFFGQVVAAVGLVAALGMGVGSAQGTLPVGIGIMKMGAASNLTGPNGHSLYVFDNDTVGNSHCNAACAVKWPPLLAKGTDQAVGDYTIIVRDDGSKQWAHKGMPLYYFQGDKDSMDMMGDGFGGKWHLAKP